MQGAGRGGAPETDRFLAAFTGVEPVGAYFAATNMLRILGLRGALGLAAHTVLGKLRASS